MDVFFYEAFEEEAEKIKQHLPENITAGFTWKTIQEYGEKEPPAGLVSIRTQSQIPEEWADKIEGILSRSTGYDHLKKYEKQTGKVLPMGYLPLYCHRAVAEHAFMLMLALMRKLPRQISNFDTFHRDGITGMELQSKKLLVVGVGNIGSQVVEIGHAMGMTVLPVDIDHKFTDLKYVTIEEGLEQADIIVCAMNLTDENEGYFNYEVLKKAKPGAVFINISRGELSVSEDLLKLLEEGHLGAVGMDVYEEEKELAVSLRSSTHSNNPKVASIKKMKAFDNVIFTPHNAFNSAEGVERKSGQSVQQTVQFLEKKEFIWGVPEG